MESHRGFPAIREHASLPDDTRVAFHVVPTSGSWLNAVEGFFARLSKRRFKRGVFRSLVDLQTAINRFVDEHNRNHAKPFTWTADPDKIIPAVKPGHQVLQSIRQVPGGRRAPLPPTKAVAGAVSTLRRGQRGRAGRSDKTF